MKKDYIPDYMCALQAKFFVEPRVPELEQEIDRLHESIAQSLDEDGRRKLLKLIDTTGELQCRITQSGFVAGFRLAGGIAKELSLEEPYSFNRDEEQRALESFRNEKANYLQK